MQPDEARARIAALGFAAADADTLFRHFDDAERRGKLGHGYARIPWLETLPDLDPAAVPEGVLATDCFERWEGRGALGYLTLSAIVDAQLVQPPEHARVIAASQCFPTGMLGHYVRRLADGGLVSLLTATSPPRLAHPDGGASLVGTNPLAIGVPSSDGRSLVTDVSPAKATFGEVLADSQPKRTSFPSAATRRTRRLRSRSVSSSSSTRSSRATAPCSSSRSPRPTRCRRYVPPLSGSACPVIARNSGSAASETKSSSATADLAKRGSRSTDAFRCAMASSRRPSSAS